MKKRFKHFLSTIICLLLCCSMVMPTVLANDEGLHNFVSANTYYDGQFTDVSGADWFSDEVRVSYELGLVKGESASSFNPNGNMRVSEAITLACRLHSIYYNNDTSFVQGSPWYQVYVDYAVDNAMITNDQFTNYDAYATRAEFAVLLASALPDEALPAINEIEVIPDVFGYETYSEAVYKLYNAGILTGNDAQGTFAPHSTIRRCEVAAIVSRMAITEMRKTVSLSTNDIESVISEYCNNYNSKTNRSFGEILSWSLLSATEIELYLSTDHTLNSAQLSEFEAIGSDVLDDAVQFVYSHYSSPDDISISLTIEYYEEASGNDDYTYEDTYWGDQDNDNEYDEGGIGYNGSTVYVTPTGKRYHYSASCAGKNARAISLSDAQRAYSPCNTCVQ